MKPRKRIAPTKEHPLGFTKKGTPRIRRSSSQMKQGFEVRKRPAHIRRAKPDNYLKYHRVVMAWARKQYNITTVHLDMIFFLYDEDIFNKTKFKEYGRIMPFDRHKLERMINDGWVRRWRDDRDHRFALYELTGEAKALYNSVRARLEGHEKISEFADTNELIKKTNSKHRMYKVMIKKMNKEVEERRKQDRHPGREDWEPAKKKRRGPNKSNLPED